MRFSGLGAIAALGAMLAMPVFAQTTIPAMPAMPKPAMPTMPAAPSAPAMPAMPSVAKPAMPAMPAAKPVAGPVDINSATSKELDAVKFIGPKRAAKIIAGRPWKSPDDLVAKKVLPQKTFDKIKDRLIVR